MKKQLSLLSLVIVSVVGFSQSARVQVIHNSADALTATVDVYVNGMLTLDNVNFRTASPFTDLPAGVPLIVGVAPDDSVSASDAFYTETFTLTENETYVIIAGGIESASGYNPAPPFDLHVFDMARETSMDPLKVDVLIYQGSTDAPVMDAYETEVGLGQIVDNIAYSEYQGYFEFPSDNYTIELRNESGTQPLAAYIAALESLGLEGIAVTVLASGFFDPSQNSNGPAFGLYAVSPLGGGLIPLPPAPLAVADFKEEMFQLYPNPVDDVLNTHGVNFTDYTIRISDISGRIVSEKFYEIENNRLRVDRLSSGMYVLSLFTKGTLSASGKFIKQ
ncbi:MAG: DUF4397 domain-containing protein [Flavobacterium sp.]|nr:MAG: DUF4397 domain-containing protein [Flavobacterium sp.]